MDPFTPKISTIAFCVAALLAFRSIKKKSLTPTGAITGFLVGFLLVATGLRGMILFYFYQLGSWATKYKMNVKAKLDATVQVSSCRGSKQVLAVSLVAVVFSLYHAYVFGAEKPIQFDTDSLMSSMTKITPSSIACAVLAHHATGLADTLASELGILTTQQPFLITQPWRKVAPGTNGGVTIAGFLWSALGGAIVGALTVLMDCISGIYPMNGISVVIFGGICGLLGSVIDSLLGATIQITYYDVETKQVLKNDSNLPPSAKRICGADLINNEQVNFLSMLITSVLGGWILGPWFFVSFT